MSIPSGEALMFTAGKLLRLSELVQSTAEAQRRAELMTVLMRSLLSAASVHRNESQLEEALKCLEEAGRYGADIGVMHKALLSDMETSRQP